MPAIFRPQAPGALVESSRPYQLIIAYPLYPIQLIPWGNSPRPRLNEGSLVEVSQFLNHQL